MELWRNHGFCEYREYENVNIHDKISILRTLQEIYSKGRIRGFDESNANLNIFFGHVAIFRAEFPILATIEENEAAKDRYVYLYVAVARE